MTSEAPTSTLDGWAVAPFSGAGFTYDCYEKGNGPGVVLVPELPGMTPEVLGLAERIVSDGFTVVIPSPFGTPGRPASVGYTLNVLSRVCVSAEFRAFATNAHRPITDYLRAVAADLASRTPGPGVGVIGMCFTGGFALAAAVDDSVLAAVPSQAATPFPVGRARQLDPGVSQAELARIVQRTKNDNLCLLGLRFSEDASASRGRYQGLKDRLGDAFEFIEIDSSDGNPGGFSKGAHSVLTNEVREGNPAWDARERVVAFLHRQLDPAS
jgi:dienelactone hydrolase